MRTVSGDRVFCVTRVTGVTRVRVCWMTEDCLLEGDSTGCVFDEAGSRCGCAAAGAGAGAACGAPAVFLRAEGVSATFEDSWRRSSMRYVGGGS